MRLNELRRDKCSRDRYEEDVEEKKSGER